MPGSGENYIYYIGAFKKNLLQTLFYWKENHELNAHHLTLTYCCLLVGAFPENE